MPNDEIEIGDNVAVMQTFDAGKDLMYAGWRAVVREINGTRAFIDSDDYWRRTGRAQAVSFRGWFPLSGLQKVARD